MKKWCMLLLLLLLPNVLAVSNVQHTVDGTQVTLTYEGTPPFLINIRGDQNIGQAGGYVWAKTDAKSYTVDLEFANNPSGEFWYGVKDGTIWDSDGKISLICRGGDDFCPWECNDWKLDNDCGTPLIHDFIESKSPQYYLDSNMVYWDDTDWRNYQPLVARVSEITSGLTDDFEKAKAIGNWVKNSRPYGGYFTDTGELVVSDYESPANKGKSIIEIYNHDTGVCMDAAILTAAMLRVAGIPSRAFFPNGGPLHVYSDAYIDGRWIGIDATFGCLVTIPNCVPGSTASIIDPISNIVWPTEFIKHKQMVKVTDSAGQVSNLEDVSFYKINMIPNKINKCAVS